MRIIKYDDEEMLLSVWSDCRITKRSFEEFECLKVWRVIQHMEHFLFRRVLLTLKAEHGTQNTERFFILSSSY
jgi:hypothetical protein